ncbi:MAG TPA: hypothetical protein VM841_06560, partial [Actinomycetota bacterium]|nr:hypothetical protein [Actinomycetota bacterium]
ASGDQIIVTMKHGSVPSTTGWVFAARPAQNPAGATLAKCTFTVVSSYAANIVDAAKNPLSARAAPATVLHAPGMLAAAPVTGDRNNDGVIDEIQLVSHHAFDASSVSSGALTRLTITDPSNASVRATGLTVRSVAGQVLTVGFTPAAGWSAATTPMVAYTTTADCMGSVLRILTPVGDQQCLSGFSLRAINGTGRG